MNKSLTRKELYNLVWSIPMIKLGKKFDLSDNGIRKVCKKYCIPTPPMGYWQKIEFGKKVSKVPLPDFHEDIIIFNKKDISNILMEEQLKIGNVIEQNKLLINNIPSKLINPDEITRIAKHAIEDRLKDEWVRRSPTIEVHGNAPRVAISKTLIPRTLNILDALIKNFRVVGYRVSVEKEGLFIYSGDEKMEIYIKEREAATTSLNDRGWKNRTLSPTGKLSIKVRYYWQIFEFTDDKTKQIESKMLVILTKIEREFLKRKEQLRIWNIEREKLEAIRRIEEDKQKRKAEELQKFVTYYNEAHRWKKYIVLKEYYDYLKINNLKKEADLAWIQKKLDWYNPILDASDELLEEVNKDSLVFGK